MKMIRCLVITFLCLSAQSKAQNCPADTEVSVGRFINNNDGTFNDTRTGLRWRRCFQGQVYDPRIDQCEAGTAKAGWRGAMRYAVAENIEGFGGVNNWRVPNLKELAMILRYGCRSPALDAALFNQLEGVSWVWSNTPSLASSRAFAVDVINGRDATLSREARHSVLLVSSGDPTVPLD